MKSKARGEEGGERRVCVERPPEQRGAAEGGGRLMAQKGDAEAGLSQVGLYELGSRSTSPICAHTHAPAPTHTW